jgi:hypothetical protein
MMNLITSVLGAKRTTTILPFAILLLALGGCGDRGTSGESVTTSAETGGGETTPARTSGGETTFAGTSEEGTVPADVLSATVGLSPNQDSGVSGTAVLTDTPSGTEVTINVRNLLSQPGAEYLAHIHEGGTCTNEREGNSAVVQYALDSLTTEQGGNGSSTTSIPDVTVAQFFSGAPKYVDVHAEATGDEVPPSISCADIYTTTGGD